MEQICFKKSAAKQIYKASKMGNSYLWSTDVLIDYDSLLTRFGKNTPQKKLQFDQRMVKVYLKPKFMVTARCSSSKF